MTQREPKTEIFAENRRFSQIHPFSWKFQLLEGAGNRRKLQSFAENRRFSQKTAGNRRLGSVTLGASPLARPKNRFADSRESPDFCESFQGSRTEPPFLRIELRGGQKLRIAGLRRFAQISRTFFGTRSTTTRDRKLKFRGAVSTGGSPLDFLLFLRCLCAIY